ncbi:Uncharacterized protein OBRU01_10042 [Operophtera brumata]|uniref:Uncharacterized protein n=1 Tax=Operophtera brumata TaxID=104452 RepID=A0A0L7LER4_OPEBR|nr:Uncharacterized protein OBRU01_10042 [Operophtera brumata]
MCRSNIEKETVFLNQNAAGSNNGQLEEIKNHLSMMTIMMVVVCSLLLVAAVFILYKLYKKCHQRWAQQEFQRPNRGSISRRRRQQQQICPDMKIEDSKM